MSFHGASIAKVLPTDVASECLDACVLHQVTRQTVRRCKPATTDLAVIGIETFVHRHVLSEACPVGESLSTLTTLMSQITRDWQLVLIHPPGVPRHCLEHKQASVRHLQASVRHLLASVRHLQTSLRHILTSVRHLHASVRHLQASVRHIKASVRHINTSLRNLLTSVRHLNASVSHLQASVRHILASVRHLQTSLRNLLTSVSHLHGLVRHLLASVRHSQQTQSKQLITMEYMASETSEHSFEHAQICKDIGSITHRSNSCTFHRVSS